VDWTGFPREHTPCILCGAESGELLSIRRSWPVVRCRACGLVYLSERPSETALEQLYSKAYYEDGDVGYKGYMETFGRHHEVFMRLFARRERDLRRRVRGRRLLEVGCAYGLLLDYLSERGWEVSGVEVSPLSSAHAREELGLDVRTGTLEQAGFPAGSFDAVLLLDVLEHLHRPFDTLGEISRLLAPGGVLVVQCPWELFHWEEVMQALLTGRRPGTIEPDAVPAHLYFFGPKTLEGILRKGGFRITGRQSGNYGEVRRRVLPPICSSRNPVVRFLHFAYHRMGVQRVLYTLARLTGLGNGLIRYAVAERVSVLEETPGS
jgi:2-polyprenyl-3-methyl-5-hydroxy-6-metoxy-1,4-benzoquinol methylase